jgi:acetyl esterase/lipase
MTKVPDEIGMNEPASPIKTTNFRELPPSVFVTTKNGDVLRMHLVGRPPPAFDPNHPNHQSPAARTNRLQNFDALSDMTSFSSVNRSAEFNKSEKNKFVDVTSQRQLFQHRPAKIIS